MRRLLILLTLASSCAFAGPYIPAGDLVSANIGASDPEAAERPPLRDAMWAVIRYPGTTVAALIWIYLFAHHPKLDAIDHVVIVAFSLLWMRYGLRVIAIARGFDDMPPGEDSPGTRRHFGRRR